MSCRIGRETANAHGMTDLFGSWQICMTSQHGSESVLDLLGKRGGAPGLHADMKCQLFRGSRKISLFTLKHLLDEVQTFAVVIQQLEVDIDGIALGQLLQIVHMHLQHKTRALAGAHVLLADADLVEDMIESLVEEHVVVGHVEMAVVVDPFREHDLAWALQQ